MKVAVPIWGVLCVAVWLALMGCDDHEDLIIITESLPNGRVGDEYFFTLEVEGDGDEFLVAAGNLPPGIQLVNSGVLLGTPTSAGTYTFTIEVLDLSDGFIIDLTSQGFSLLIEP
jgi:Putative Ig domain